MAKTYTTSKNPEKSDRGRKTFTVGRDSSNGQFLTASEAERRPNTTTVERVPKAGRGHVHHYSEGKSAKSVAGSALTQRPVTKPGKISDKEAMRAVDSYLAKARK